ncbi:hypothetical protein ASE91_11195 [Sphingomonas sp. Leaf62]|nr:hypothetical protein ASE91_11195 [Sphingomonas sp. Leaf62]
MTAAARPAAAGRGIDLDRRFLPQELRGADPWAAASRREETRDWDWALGHRVVALLDQAGAGKSHEMRERAATLRRADGDAFYMRIERLCSMDFRTALDDEAQRAAFDRWIVGRGEAVFMLDSVDEAKLPSMVTTTPLPDALSALQAALGAAVSRIRLVVSSRGSEWHDRSEQEPLEAFAGRMAAARGDTDGGVVRLALAPLDEDRIMLLARSRGADDGLMALLEASDLIDDARTPLDAIHYADHYVAHRGGDSLERSFASRGAVLRASVERRLRDADAEAPRPPADQVAAMRAVRRLAFALTVAQSRDIALPGRGASGIDAAALLTVGPAAMTIADVRGLLATPLFAPAEAGTIRFYRPEVTAMLAAEHLRDAIRVGASAEATVGTFLATPFGQTLVPAAHGPMLAWLASHDRTALALLLDHGPVWLIQDGDPRTLPVDDLAAALSRHVGGGADWLPGGYHLDQAALRRFARPALEDHAVALLAGARGAAKEHLVEIARAGKYSTAGPQLAAMVGGGFAPSGLRLTAVVALAACGAPANLAEAASDLVAWGPPLRPPGEIRFEAERDDEIIVRLIAAGYPSAFGADTALRLLRLTTGKQYATAGVRLVPAMVAAPAADLPVLAAGLDAMSFAASAPRSAVSARGSISLRALGATLARVVAERPDLIDAAMLATLRRFLRTIRGGGGRHGYALAKDEALFSAIRKGAAFRQAAFAIVAAQPGERLDLEAVRTLLIEPGLPDEVRATDLDWMFRMYRDSSGHMRDRIAEAIRWWSYVPGGRATRRRLAAAALRHPSGIDTDTLRALSPKPVARLRNWWAEERHGGLRHRGWRIANWWSERRDAGAMLRSLAGNWFRLARGRPALTVYAALFGETADLPDETALRDKRWAPLARRLVAGAIAHADRHRPTGRIGHYDPLDMLAHAGTGFAWRADPRWFDEGDRALRALRLAIDLGQDWPDWATAVVARRPDLWREVAGQRVAAELARPGIADDRPAGHALTRIALGGDTMAAPLAATLTGMLSTTGVVNVSDIAMAGRIVVKDPSCAQAASAAARRHARDAMAEGAVSRALTWLRVWAHHDPDAIDQLLRWTRGPLADSDGIARALDVLSSLLDRDHGAPRRIAPLPATTVAALASFVFDQVDPADDAINDRLHRRGPRQRAEEVRRHVSAMLDQDYTPEGRAVLENFVSTRIAPRYGDWARHWLVKHAHDAARPRPWTMDDIRRHEAELGRLPADGDALMDLVVMTIAGIERDLAASEFDRRGLLHKNMIEAEFRAWLGHELDRRHRAWYSVTQESVTAGENRTDLRIELRLGGDEVVVVEIKIAHRWSRQELHDKLRTQLVDQYLIDGRTRRGIYLIVDLGLQPYGQMSDGSKPTLSEIVAVLDTQIGTDPALRHARLAVQTFKVARPPRKVKTVGSGKLDTSRNSPARTSKANGGVAKGFKSKVATVGESVSPSPP